VIPKICDLCEQQRLEKPASLYWAWTNANGARRAWKQRICPDCFRSELTELIVRSTDPVLICPACGIGTAEDYDAVYLSYFLPGMPGGQAEFPMCPPCAAVLRGKAIKGARQLEDRGAPVGGPQPQAPTAAETWADLGYLVSPRGNGG
jgi:hypothetical protein